MPGTTEADTTPVPGVTASKLSGWRSWAVPSLSDFLLGALLVWLLVATSDWGGGRLLMDAGAGVHIQTGEWIIENGRVPDQDIFSFSRPGEPWFAWEWLSDIGMALVMRAGGIPAIVLAASAVICVTFLISIRHMLFRGANALAVTLVAPAGFAVSSIHFLARPHLLTLLLMAATWWLLDYDRRKATPWIWTLIPVTAVWVNLHGGFTGLIVTLVALTVGTCVESILDPVAATIKRTRATRYAGLLGGCLCASLANPYGIHLHQHLIGYLRAGWIRDMVSEFQAPDFNMSGAIYLELLMFAGLFVAFRVASKGDIASALVLLGWAHASLSSVRHFPIFFIVLAPLLAAEIMDLWRKAVDRWGSLPTELYRLGNDYSSGLARNSVALLIVPCVLFTGITSVTVPREFPATRFPVSVVDQHGELIADSRVFTTDHWADYLIYRNYPEQRVFLDGRTDFFGEALANDYVTVLNAGPGWEEIVERYGMDLVLLPPGGALPTVLKELPEWRTIVSNPDAVLYQKR